MRAGVQNDKRRGGRFFFFFVAADCFYWIVESTAVALDVKRGVHYIDVKRKNARYNTPLKALSHSHV